VDLQARLRQGFFYSIEKKLCFNSFPTSVLKIKKPILEPFDWNQRKDRPKRVFAVVIYSMLMPHISRVEKRNPHFGVLGGVSMSNFK